MIPPRIASLLRNTQGRRVTTAIGVSVAIAILYALLAPRWYRATLTVVPTTQTKSAGAAQLSALGLDLPLEIGSADVERIAAVLESNSVTDAVVDKFDLINRYDTRYRELARKKLWTRCSTRVDRKAKLVSMSCEDRDPAFVQSLLAHFSEVGNSAFRRVSVSSATEEVKFLEARVEGLRRQTDEAAQKQREFEETYKIVDLDTQSKAVVSALAALRAQEMGKDLELSYLNSFSSAEEASVLQLRKELALVGSKFRQLEGDTQQQGAVAARDSQQDRRTFFPAAVAVPKLRYEYQRLLADRKIHETDLALMIQRLEMAKVNEARDTSAFQVLDAPVRPTYPSRPVLSVAVVAGLLIGLFCGIAWAFGPEYIGLIRRAATPPHDVVDDRQISAGKRRA